MADRAETSPASASTAGTTGRWSDVTGSSACTGNPFWVRATDPWVTFAPDGTAYFMHLELYSTFVPSAGRRPVRRHGSSTRSTTAGSPGSEPTTLVLDTSPTAFHDKNSITADPNDSDFVYAVWDG